MHAALDAEFSLVVITSKVAHTDARVLAAAWQDVWGYPRAQIEKGDAKTPGDHGDPEIGRQESAFFQALTEGQKAAHKAVEELVYQLYAANESWVGVDPWKIDEPLEEWKQKAFYELATHPLRTYMLGQMLGSAAMKTPLHRPLLPTDGEAIAFLEATTFNEIDASFEALKGDLRRALIAGMVARENPREVARKLTNELNDYTTQWKVVTITETARAESTGRLAEYRDADVEYCIISSAHDAKACDFCLNEMDGKVFKVSDIINVTNYHVKRADWRPCCPAHPNCRCVVLPYKVGDPLDVTR